MVDVHYVSLDVDAARLNELNRLITPEERDRAARFRFDLDRNRFIACRGMLRELLDSREPFAYGAFGKPRLEGSEVRFNVSHSHNMAMIAVAHGREVGCDIERIDPSFTDYEVAAEAAMLRALPEQDRCAAFFRCWTRKEAHIKACGAGFGVPLVADGWSFHDVDAPEGYAAAIVVADHPSITIPTNSLISSITKSGGAAANVSG